ncbi:MAG: hypothetical protein ACKV0T_14725 [Planctomycetales bacterium]
MARIVQQKWAIPRRALVWYRFDGKTLEYQRRCDPAPQTCDRLARLGVRARTNRRGEIVRYVVALSNQSWFVIDPTCLDQGHNLADQLAAATAVSPRWMFPPR